MFVCWRISCISGVARIPIITYNLNMNRTDFEILGNKQKRFEESFGSLKLVPGIPYIVRLDGHSFHTVTKGMRRPYDERLSRAMTETTQYLVGRYNASVGYTQSDEITLGFLGTDFMLFDGRIVKICTILASACTAKFNEIINREFPGGLPSGVELPEFDARAFSLQTQDLIDNLVWRQTDASRNSLTMAAHAHFPQKELHGAGKAKKHDMLMSIGINWNDYPVHFKRGIFVRKMKVWKQLDPEILAKIPPDRRPTGPIIRNVVKTFDPGVLESYSPLDRFNAVFGNGQPVDLDEPSQPVPSAPTYVEP